MMLAMTSSELIPGGESTRDDDHQPSGLYVCQRCGLVAAPSEAEIEQAQSSPEGNFAKLRCHHCGKRAVEWHEPSAPDRARKANGNVVVKRALPVDAERGAALWQQVKQTLGL